MIRVYDRKELQEPTVNASLNNVSNVVYSANEDNKHLYVNITIEYSDDTSKEFNVAIDKNLFSDNILTVALLKTTINSKFHSIVFDTKYSQVYGYYSRGSDFNLFNAASIWISSSTTDTTIVPHVKINGNWGTSENLEYNQIDFVDNDPQTTLLSLVPDAQHKKDIWFLKKRYIQNLLDPYESIAYLEGQVDVLSKVINLLIEKTGLDVGEYKTVLEDIDKHTVIDVKTLDKIKSEISKDKANVRNIQRAYYLVKNG